MRKIFGLFCFFAVLCPLYFASCDDYDDTAITERVDKIDDRVKALETIVAQLNGSLSGLVTSIDALSNQDKIVSVTPLPDGNGYSIVFEKAGTVTLYNGENGIDGKDGKDGLTHQIGVKKDSDGLYYWTIDGEWLIGDGAKVPATAKVVVPQIKIEEGKFLFSTNGTDWTEIGDAGSSGVGIISNVIDTTENVTLVLSDGSSIDIPKVQQFAISIDGSSFAIADGGRCSFYYEITGGDNQTRVKAYAESGYIVTVNTARKRIIIDAPAEAVTADIIIIATNGKGQMCGKIISIEKGVLSLIEDTIAISAKGGEVTAKLSVNSSYQLMIDPSAGWIHEVVETKVTRTEDLKFLVDENTTDIVRTGQVYLTNDIGMMQILNITQEARSEPQSPTEEWTYANLFEGFTVKSAAEFTYESITNTSGWTAKNFVYAECNGYVAPKPEYRLRLSGSIEHTGTLDSPTIEAKISQIKVCWGVVGRSLRAGYSFSVILKDANGNAIKEIVQEDKTPELDISDFAGVEQELLIEVEANFPNVFKISIKNNCPKNAVGDTDIIDILKVAWK